MVKKQIDKQEPSIKKEDLKLIALELLDLKFNRGGYELTCDYILEKLKEEGVKVNIDSDGESGEFNGLVYNYSTKGKKEGVKAMASKIVESGEIRGLTGEDSIGLWLNHAVEFMGRRITEKVTSKFINMVETRRMNMWEMWGRMENEQAKEEMWVDINKIDTMWQRTKKNLKENEHDIFVGINRFIW